MQSGERTRVFVCVCSVLAVVFLTWHLVAVRCLRKYTYFFFCTRRCTVVLATTRGLVRMHAVP
jgi:hypothetical protein